MDILIVGLLLISLFSFYLGVEATKTKNSHWFAGVLIIVIALSAIVILGMMGSKEIAYRELVKVAYEQNIKNEDPYYQYYVKELFNDENTWQD